MTGPPGPVIPGLALRPARFPRLRSSGSYAAASALVNVVDDGDEYGRPR